MFLFAFWAFWSAQGLAEGNSTLANRAAVEAKEARTKAEIRAEQAEAQVDQAEGRNTSGCRARVRVKVGV